MNIKKIIQREMMIEAEAIKLASKKIDKNIVKAVDFICNCKGKLVTTGMGKSGLIARKISATFASTGTTAIYLHPAEGIHGDLGMLQMGDVVLALSHSGNTQELVSIISYIKFNEIRLIAITGNLDSKAADDVMELLQRLNKEQEATIMLVTHDLMAATYCDRVIFIKDGELYNEVYCGESRQAFYQKIIDVLALLGGRKHDFSTVRV